jgi:hypothetical protein
VDDEEGAIGRGFNAAGDHEGELDCKEG